MPRLKAKNINRNKRRRKHLGSTKVYELRHSNLSTDELLEISQLLRQSEHGVTINLTSQTPKVRQYVNYITRMKSPKSRQLSLDKVNTLIVKRNARENHPTKAVQSIYRSMLQEE